MTESARFHDVTAELAESNAIARLGEANKHAMDFLFGAQRIFLEEVVFMNDELLERFRTESHLFAEYISKLAGSHSVKDLRTMCQECGQHQLDFIRRDCERIFKHGERLIETTSKLVDSRPRI
ncbi:MAG: hypothetical protein HY852_05755 [Bradyrhizobium sp.]|uniref:hypothetical protein n=1 Tax=Bradyrhizobium sp. TaxID=376 RepID=UPI0025BA7EF2|nr:hypothetical protein [Bradyrhizobium sp.]MBI5261309.1 hypothetical protein [Bradyrhizobium sp.]